MKNIRWKPNLVSFFLLSDVFCLLFTSELAWLLRLSSRVQNVKRQMLEKVNKVLTLSSRDLVAN